MDHYLDIELQLDPEFSTPHLMSALFSKLHRSLISHADIGVSFPGFDALTPNLGTQLRLHSGHRSLSDLMALNWLAGMRDHVRLGCLDKVPAACQHRVVRRVQSQSSPDRLRRRLMHRHSLDMEQAFERIPDSAANFLKLPFVQLRSTSTGQSFRLFIEHGGLVDNPTVGSFGAYGLSQSATVPWF